MDGDRGDLAEFEKNNATQIMIFLPHYMWAENNNNNRVLVYTVTRVSTLEQTDPRMTWNPSPPTPPLTT